MKLLTKEIVNNMPALYETEDLGNDAPIIVKFFAPWSNWTWYAKEASAIVVDDHDDDFRYHPLRNIQYDNIQKFLKGQKTRIADIVFFGLVDGFDKELGYFYMSELLSAKGPWGLRIERDMHFNGKTIKDVM